jgi:hypothetical protein
MTGVELNREKEGRGEKKGRRCIYVSKGEDQGTLKIYVSTISELILPDACELNGFRSEKSGKTFSKGGQSIL